jgi:hypothetical protein
MKKLLVLVLLAGAAYAVYVTLRPAEKRACARVAELCGFDSHGSEVEQCTQMLDSLKKSNASSVAQATGCVADAKSCGEATGCASAAALTVGAGFAKDFLKGLQNAAK